ncbi:hypothetical protein PHLGIDRAFT_338070 [Phlebiopsis gigantea 11061_1 CR5-6]|uniref:Uncharacterized protein n=1 Tax=Phlebiopsis gigantea (strain 11061_1 CR5-6) TaxID=745531 RepID=A0A0C3S222_PHLG1|nr:hypothetical protein PHLGIDRAFT_338070 [Phlebiopsis gigantea 11061_1 CR5-6]
MGQSQSLQSADAEAGAVQGFCGFVESLCSLVSSRVEEFTSKHGTVLPTSSPLEKSSIGQAPIPEDESSSAGSVVSTVISSATTSVVNPAGPSSFKKTQPQVPSTHPTSLDAVTVDVSITDTVTSASAAAIETSQLMDTTPTDGGKSTPTTGTMTVTAASSVSLDTDTTTLDILPSPSDSLIAGSSNPSPRNASAIAGGVVGGVVLIVLCALSPAVP